MARQPDRRPGAPFAGMMTLGWIAFAILAIWFPTTLAQIWSWLTGLPLWAEVIVWIVTLPYALSLWIWRSGLDEWARALLVIGLALIWTSASVSRPRGRDR